MKQMYKVFLNERVIKIGSRENITNKQTTVTFDENCGVEVIRKWFSNFVTSDMDEVFVVQEKPEAFFRLFQSAFDVIPAAGGVVVAGNRLLFIFRNGKWDLPKGKMEKNERAEAAALREVEEETGISPAGIDRRLPSTFHMYKSSYPGSRGQWIFKETHWYQMSYSGSLTGTPQQEEGITQVKWMAKNALEKVMENTYENLKQVINLYRV